MGAYTAQRALTLLYPHHPCVTHHPCIYLPSHFSMLLGPLDDSRPATDMLPGILLSCRAQLSPAASQPPLRVRSLHSMLGERARLYYPLTCLHPCCVVRRFGPSPSEPASTRPVAVPNPSASSAIPVSVLILVGRAVDTISKDTPAAHDLSFRICSLHWPK